MNRRGCLTSKNAPYNQRNRGNVNTTTAIITPFPLNSKIAHINWNANYDSVWIKLNALTWIDFLNPYNEGHICKWYCLCISIDIRKLVIIILIEKLKSFDWNRDKHIFSSDYKIFIEAISNLILALMSRLSFFLVFISKWITK